MTRRTILMLFLGIATLFLATGQAMALTINSAITKDVSIYSHDAAEILDHNFGAYDFDVGHGIHPALGLANRPGSTHDQQRPLLKAGNVVSDLTTNGVTASSQITSAELHLFQIFPHVAPARTAKAHRLTTGGWVEGDGEFSFVDGATTWNNVLHGGTATPSVGGTPWTTPGGDFDPTEVSSFSMVADPPAHTEHTVDITGAVKHWFDNAGTNFGVILTR